ncbi:MAG TPA: dTDP-4-dehydrorhamnose reductase [Kiritimatiellia bacterium]|nr:dTDP-4-dehydrorhamnose reductase [Kiritimatiellia bacterium]HMO97498.1 dTDP-4-dehydrorhamnose reductase [Kiritimatiellia bacterium]HMP96307.1 dTDP-4-dehydrorhamnose reductase [Kiritimatiellia bacterium]
MKVVYIGARGMLGRDVLDAARARAVEVIGLDLPELDITNPESVAAVLPECDVVINGAAFTRVDDAEREIEPARRINADGAGHVARVCAERGIRLLHVSTDYVFNGRKGTEYLEADAPDPLSVYGITKWQGEVLVREAGGSSVIVRTQSLYGVHGRNFVKAILNQLRQGKKELTVVSDQVSSPTYTRHLAEALLNLAGVAETGLVHVAARGACSWHQFAQEIVSLLGLRGVDVRPMAAAELKYPAPRPAYSVLATDRYTAWTGSLMPSWREGLKAYLQEEELAVQPWT